MPGGPGGWVKLNAGQFAPVRVEYPATQWAALAGAAEDASQLPQVTIDKHPLRCAYGQMNEPPGWHIDWGAKNCCGLRCEQACL